MPSPSARPAASKKKEPSYQIGIPLDGRDHSALQPEVDHFDQDDTARDHAAPPKAQVATEVSLPGDLPRADEPLAEPEVAPAPAPAPAPAAASGVASSRSAPPRSAPSRSARASSRSSKRTAATSAVAPQVSSRRTIAVDRSGLLKVLLLIGLGVLAVIIVVTGIIVLATRGSESRRVGGEALAEAGRQLELVKSALSNRRGADARKAYEAALQPLISTPELGGAVAAPPEEKPVVRDLAFRAFELRSEIERINARIIEVQDENSAESQLAVLKGRFATLSDPATDLDELEKDILAYMENPVDPKAGASLVNAETFRRQASEAKLRLAAIVTERDRRKAERTATPLRLAAVETDGLIQQERFGEALAKLQELAANNAGADFGPLKAQVEDSAEKAWRSAKAKVDNHLADWRSRGASEGQRQAGLAAAKERLNQVIQRFGIPTYVDQARTLLTPLP